MAALAASEAPGGPLKAQLLQVQTGAAAVGNM